MGQKNKRSLNDFDYFGSHQLVADLDTLEEAAKNANDESLYQKIRLLRRHRQRQRFNLFIMFIFCLLSCYFIFDTRDELAYHFAAQSAPKNLGQVESLDINKLRHNDFVTISGVTDHRAAAVKRVRNLNPNIREYHYFHLAGSRIFLETEEEKQYFPMQEVQVSGRVVDARRDHSFNSLLDFYRQKYLFNVGDNVRFIQVGQKPGENRLPYAIVFSFLGLVLLINLVAFIRHRQKVSGIIGPTILGGFKE